MTPIARSTGISTRNPDGAKLDRVSIAVTATAALFVATRIALRAQRQVLGLDDLWIAIALLFSIILTITIAISVSYGYGMHAAQLPPGDVAKALFWWYLVQVFYKAITWPTKISILLMYNRVFGATSETKAYGIRFRTLVWTMIGLSIACFISFEVAGIFACTPVARSWNHDIPGTCLNSHARYYAYVGCNLATDLIVLAMPIPLINGLNISRRQKWSLIAVFCLGGFVCITTLIRVDKLKNDGSDATYSGLAGCLWTSVEANVGIICACLPLMRPVINYLIPWFAQRTRSRSNTYDYGIRNYSARFGSQHQQHSGNFKLGDKGDAIIMSEITAQNPESSSRTSSQVAITQGIHCKIEVETHTEPAEIDIDRDSDKGSRRSSERKDSNVM